MTLSGFIWSYVRKQRWTFAAIAALAMVWTFDMLFWPFFLRMIVDVFNFFDADRFSAWPDLKIILLWGAVAWISVEGLCRLRDYLRAVAFPKMEADIRMTMFDHVQRHSPKYFNEHFSGSLANKIGDMVLSASSILQDVIVLFAPACMTCVLTIVIFASMNGFLALIVGIWMAVHFTLCWIFTLKCAHYSYLHGESRSTLAGKIVDSLTNNFVVNLFYRFRYREESYCSVPKSRAKGPSRRPGLHGENGLLPLPRFCRRNNYADVVHGGLLDGREDFYGRGCSAFLYDLELKRDYLGDHQPDFRVF